MTRKCMRPRKLVVRGFTCFRDEAEIDFTRLDLFAITGPTGAGKTSILDAMTLALHGREIYERIQKRANHVAEARRQETDLLEKQLTRDYQDVTLERAQELEAKAAASVGQVSQTRGARDATSHALEIARDVTRSR